MSWTAIQWVWRLEAPLFVGMPPAGALNRCRPYVPARVLWGAVATEICRSRESESFPDYGKIGWEVALNCRFTYLFPAEQRGDKLFAWISGFEGSEKGLLWHCHDCRSWNKVKALSDREFRRRLLDSRAGTAIDPESDSAFEGTLRETECINPYWRDTGYSREFNRVFLLGYVFLRNNSFRRQLESIETLFVGGDTRYGFGKICCVRQEVCDNPKVFGKPINLDREHPEIESNVVLGHSVFNEEEEAQSGTSEIESDVSKDAESSMRGMKELLGGWEHDNPWKGKLAWAPGSVLTGSNKSASAAWAIDKYGYWIYQGPEKQVTL